MDETTAPNLELKIPEIIVPVPPPAELTASWYREVASDLQVVLALIVVVGSQVAVQWARDKLVSMAKYRKLKQEWSLTKEQEIRHIVIKLNALMTSSRVLVSHFHNGTITTSDYSIKYITCNYEDVAPGTDRVGHLVRGFPITRLLPQITALMDGRWKKIKRDNLSEGKCKAHLFSIGVEYLCERILKRDDIPVGILTIHYNHAIDEVPDEKLLEISDLVNRLGAIL